MHDKNFNFYWFLENPIDIESLAGISEIEDNQIRPTTAQWLQNLTASVSRPATPNVLDVHAIQIIKLCKVLLQILNMGKHTKISLLAVVLFENKSFLQHQTRCPLHFQVAPIIHFDDVMLIA